MSAAPNENRPWSRIKLIRAGLLTLLTILAILTAFFLYQRQPQYEVRVIQMPEGWGYDILNRGTLIIHQPTVPGQSGKDGFASEEQARRVGERVVEKIQQTQAMPTLTNDELRQLGVQIP
ncbi:DUF4907 domain-containing protein [Spirosoma sp. BT702]|uniref:DUF4907 domain-containing protein n=1 Tax=Spirosoma profusum TaxID=2771354 RepID=A0A926Y2G0_9BACT|nr:DUF4907 domain-containing protein [Spirosoma profusum]MBD2703037.1 DUF4907 domain-containing protein [Spirosoma profusum]